jgi:hypothetical protein
MFVATPFAHEGTGIATQRAPSHERCTHSVSCSPASGALQAEVFCTLIHLASRHLPAVRRCTSELRLPSISVTRKTLATRYLREKGLLRQYLHNGADLSVHIRRLLMPLPTASTTWLNATHTFHFPLEVFAVMLNQFDQPNFSNY